MQHQCVLDAMGRPGTRQPKWSTYTYFCVSLPFPKVSSDLCHLLGWCKSEETLATVSGQVREAGSSAYGCHQDPPPPILVWPDPLPHLPLLPTCWWRQRFRSLLLAQSLPATAPLTVSHRTAEQLQLWWPQLDTGGSLVPQASCKD